MASVPDNIKDGLEAELAGLEARLRRVDDDTPGDTVAMLKRRVVEVNEALGNKPKRASAKKESRPG